MTLATDNTCEQPQASTSLEQYVCIASIGHSGSTLLGMLLDQHPRMTAMGEMTNLAIFAGDPDRTCGCGTPVKDCEFWIAVQDELRRRHSDPSLDLGEFATQPILRTTAFRTVPSLSEILQLIGRRSLWRLGSGLSRRVQFELSYGERAVSVYEAIAAVHDKPIVVNSTGATTYMKAIYLADPARFRMIHIVRDGRGWTRSMMHREDATMELAARLWARSRWNSGMMMASIPRKQKLLLRYEDLCRDTSATMSRVGQFLGVEMPAGEFKLRKQDFHGVGGNPMRFRYDEVDIRLDEKWRTDLSADDLRTFERYAGKQNRSLGYE